MKKTKKTAKKKKRPAAKPKSKPKAKAKAKKIALPKSEKPAGAVTHFFGGIKVGIFKFKKPVRVGDKIRIEGATTDFEQVIQSMQYDHKAVVSAKPGKLVGIKVAKRVREGDKVFLK